MSSLTVVVLHPFQMRFRWYRPITTLTTLLAQQLAYLRQKWAYWQPLSLRAPSFIYRFIYNKSVVNVVRVLKARVDGPLPDHTLTTRANFECGQACRSNTKNPGAWRFLPSSRATRGGLAFSNEQSRINSWY